MKIKELLSIAVTTGLLAGCAATPPPRSTQPVTTSRPLANPPRIVQSNSLVGQHANVALSLFGKPRLDVAEGAGRKLQFAGTACILDIYYYAPKAGADAIATHVDARTPDGRDASVDSCVNTLRR